MRRRRFGTWNVQYGHEVYAHVALILDTFEENRLDVLALQEVADYGDVLEREAAERGFALAWSRGAGPKAQQAILVRDESLADGVFWTFDAGPGWLAGNGDARGPMYPLALKYDGVLYVSVHAPVSVRWAGRRIVGPARRVLAYRGHSRRLLRVFRTHGRVVMGGDWNATPGTRGAWSPRWLARKAGAYIAASGRNTGHGQIDYLIAQGVDVRWTRVHPHQVTRSTPDHFLVTAVVVKDDA